MTRPQETDLGTSIVALDRFILATRDSGYKGTPSAIAELVDNSLQAGARRIEIVITSDSGEPRWPLTVSVADDGVGMSHSTLCQALRFGGSARFNDRRGLGRFGMGLPNSSLSQARRVEVITWQSPGRALVSHLDTDEIATGQVTEIPPPALCGVPKGMPGETGTLVRWLRCDRLEFKRPDTIIRKLAPRIGRVFRHFLLDGVVITLNGNEVAPIDPLFLDPCAVFNGARQFGAPIRYEVATLSEDHQEEIIGEVQVIFSELPVQEWHCLPNAEKRARGIAKGAGVSVVRAGREIDHGWFFLGSKRKENYDDWWRCEICFEPELDDLFGITHTKQQIRPSPALSEVLTRDIEATARALNARARRAHEVAKVRRRLAVAEHRASGRDARLTPLPDRPLDERQRGELERLAVRFPGLLDGTDSARFRLIIDTIPGTRLYEVYPLDGLLLVVMNSQHPFFTDLYGPLMESGRGEDDAVRSLLDLVILAAARGEAAEDDAPAAARGLVQRWSDVLSEFLKDEANG